MLFKSFLNYVLKNSKSFCNIWNNKKTNYKINWYNIYSEYLFEHDILKISNDHQFIPTINQDMMLGNFIFLLLRRCNNRPEPYGLINLINNQVGSDHEKTALGIKIYPISDKNILMEVRNKLVMLKDDTINYLNDKKTDDHDSGVGNGDNSSVGKTRGLDDNNS
jgi:hypothetical protein